MKYLILSLLFCNFLLACKKPIPAPQNEEELITTLQINIVANGDTSAYRFSDPDGEGGWPASTDTIFLQDSSTYAVFLSILDESRSPATDLTGEILQERNDHLLCFQASGILLDIDRTDRDDNNFPVGLNSSWTTGTGGKGTLQVTLKHQPGIKNGTCEPGDTDIEVVFPVVIRD